MTMMTFTHYSNCVIVAWRQFRALRRAGERVALFIRPSDADDPWLIHVGWQVYDRATQTYRPASFRPVVFERSLPWYQRLRRLSFLGRVVDNDDPPPAAIADPHRRS